MRLAAFLAAAIAVATSATAQSVDVRVKRDVPASRCGPLDYLMVPTLGIAPRCQERAAAADRKQVLVLLEQGRCAEAVSGALKLGDLHFAKEVREFCASSAPQVAGAGPTSPEPATR